MRLLTSLVLSAFLAAMLAPAGLACGNAMLKGKRARKGQRTEKLPKVEKKEKKQEKPALELAEPDMTPVVYNRASEKQKKTARKKARQGASTQMMGGALSLLLLAVGMFLGFGVQGQGHSRRRRRR